MNSDAHLCAAVNWGQSARVGAGFLRPSRRYQGYQGYRGFDIESSAS
jgi:hypothetical protein